MVEETEQDVLAAKVAGPMTRKFQVDCCRPARGRAPT